MGTLFTLTALANQDPARAFQAAFLRIGELDQKLSDYKDDSELNRVCRAGGGEVSEDLATVIDAAQRLAADSDGAFDITLGPVIRLWRAARRAGKLPAPADLNAAADRTGYTHLSIRGREVRLELPQMQLDVGAIGKGFAAREALKVLASNGVTHALVAASGDLAVGGGDWRVGLCCGRVFTLSHCGVSTSGDSEQFAVIDGVRYSHIIDPHTHRPLTTPHTVSVVAPDPMTADGLATALYVLGPGRSRALLARYPAAKAYFG